MPTQTEKLNKLQDILKMVDEGLTRQEFLDAFKGVMDIVLKAETAIAKRNNEALAQLKETFDTLDRNVRGSTKAETKKAIREMRELIDNAIREHKGGMNLIMDRVKDLRDGKDGKDGRDADEEKIVDNVLTKVPKPTPKEIRDYLETLKGDERLDWKSIDGLEEALKDARVGTGTTIFGGSGVSKIGVERFILDPYTPTGTINGTNTDFVLTKAPNPAASLKVFRNGMLQSLTEDYTISGKTITFLTTPMSGEIILVEHRV